MSNSKISFEKSIQDAELILKYYDELNLNKENKKSKELEVLKRAGLIMALTAWETYIEDRIDESVQNLLSTDKNSQISQFMINKLEDELKKFHNPNSEKTQKLFVDYLNIDVTASWSWNQSDLSQNKKKLDALVKKRGEAAHRARVNITAQEPDLISIIELRGSIKFLKNLVDSTDKTLEKIT